ncbi:ankyrin repeat domain-containing protein [Dactylosporangium sp. CS-047395]|uniref:ankyrin repeat domain-containing protein n=1 Tax=Dactylosporangium sp. CS-047395 TaxID=3239936 RepID=UPI003D91D89D
MLREAHRLSGQPIGADDRRVTVRDSGIVIVCTLDGDDAYTRLSCSHTGGPIDLDTAVDCAYLLLTLLGEEAAPGLAAASSPRGILHVGFAGVPSAMQVRFRVARRQPVPQGSATAWFAALEDAGRVGRDEPGLLTSGSRPTTVDTPTGDAALRDLTICRGLRDGGDPGALTAATVVHAAIACADPGVLRAALASGYDGDLGLDRLGESLCVVVDDSVTYTGPTRADVELTLGEVHTAGRDVDGHGTLLFDAAGRSARLTSVLLAHGSGVHHRNGEGTTALMRAAVCGRADVVDVLLRAGARPGDADAEGRTALHHAAAWDNAEVAERLVAGGTAVDAADRSGRTPLMHARRAALVDRLVDAGADPGATDAAGSTALMNAAASGNAEVVRALLSRGADPLAVTDKGEAAVHFAATTGPADARIAVLTALLDAGADVDEENNEGTTPLMAAAMEAHDETVRLLLQRGANVDARTVDGFTPLMHAADGRNAWTHGRDFAFGDHMLACMRLLLDAGADVDAASGHGWTALHFACLGFDAQPVRLLLERGADPNAATDDGTTPPGQARSAGHETMIDDLVRAGAREDGGRARRSRRRCGRVAGRSPAGSTCGACGCGSCRTCSRPGSASGSSTCPATG